MERFLSQMSYPTAVLLGAGACGRLGEVCGALGLKKPLVFADHATVLAGLADRVIVELKHRSIGFGLFSGAVPAPNEKDVEDGVEAYLSQGADGLIAVGGRGPLEMAKLVRLLTTHERPITRYAAAAGGSARVTGRLPPMVAVPTLAGLGLEATFRAAVRTAEGNRLFIDAPPLMPSVAVCDPELSLAQPAEHAAWAAMTALVHCVESFCAAGIHPLADALAIDGVARCGRSLVRTVTAPQSLEARTEIQIASVEGAAAAQKGLGVCTALAQAAAEVKPVSPGLAAGVLLPAVLEFNRPVIGTRLAKVAVALGEDRAGSTAELALAAIHRIRRMAREAHLPTTLQEIGVTEDLLPTLVEKAYEDPAREGNPRDAGRDDLLAIAHAVL